MEFVGRRTATLLTLMIVFVITGLYFLGQGITGKVISQSCCFPPNCPAENICDVANPSLEYPSSSTGGFSNLDNMKSSSFIFLGFGLLIAGLLVKVFHHKTSD